jgi:curli production assembly/transport component CsgG
MYKLYRFSIITLLLIFTGCGSYFNQPIGKQDARLGEQTAQTRSILNLPEPEKKVVVGVYNFKDQTGQYKPTETASTFSTAVTQGATTILIKALEDSEWFRPIERENLSNLLQERKIIDATRIDYAEDKTKVQKIAPLLFAGVILEGGIISYDSNILTGGAGARYFGVGGSTQYRQDRITIYLRAVSTSTGEVLKTVYVSKTILSQAIDAGIFRYVNFQRLLEVETGYTKNEPAELAVKEAIEKAVESLIYEGIIDGLWSTKGGAEQNAEVAAVYLKLKAQEEATGLYNRKYSTNNKKHSIHAGVGMAVIDADLATRRPDFSAKLGYKYSMSNSFRVNTDVEIFRLWSASDNRYWWMVGDLNLEYRILSKDKFAPYIYGGPGILVFVDDSPFRYLQRMDSFGKLQAGLGLEYEQSDRFSFFVQGDYNYMFSDKIDNVVNGKRDDYYYNILIGVNYKFGF